ncbi:MULTISPECIES: ferredoxin [Streptomyces]|uniref:Ferredoxin n=1 Tax=Streptomyces niveiscabiei TaxID=164115 RepID=A0ABW9HNB8_9ACTN
MVRIAVDRSLCCGAGNCVLVAPGVFDQDEDDGVVVLLTETPAPSDETRAREAAAMCPASAITLREDVHRDA